jgi:hypothetical protein
VVVGLSLNHASVQTNSVNTHFCNPAIVCLLGFWFANHFANLFANACLVVGLLFLLA